MNREKVLDWENELVGRKVLITGGRGMLGAAFASVLGKDAPATETIAFGHAELDVTRPESVERVVALAPSVIIHCAAYTAVDLCETEKEKARLNNVEGARRMAEAARRVGSAFFYPQSFLIFSHHDAPIAEDAVAEPLSQYGLSKWEGERAVLDACPDALIVRKAGLFGGEEGDKNFVGKFARHLAKLVSEGVHEVEVGDRIWQPTWSVDIARNSLALIALRRSGVYHMSSHGQATFFELAEEMVRCFGIEDRIRIVPVSADAVGRKEVARRPRIANLANRRLEAERLDFQRPWKNALHEYLSHPFFMNLFSGTRS